MKYVDVLAAVVVVVGALNWGFVGAFHFNPVAALLGDATALTRLVYAVVGVAGVFQVFQWKAIQQRWTGRGRPLAA